MEVVLDDPAVCVFKLLGLWTLPNTCMIKTGESSVNFIRTGKVGFRPLSFSSHSRFPAASEREHPHPVFPSVVDLSFSFHNMFYKHYSFNRNKFSTLCWLLEIQLPTKQEVPEDWRLELCKGHSW